MLKQKHVTNKYRSISVIHKEEENPLLHEYESEEIEEQSTDGNKFSETKMDESIKINQFPYKNKAYGEDFRENIPIETITEAPIPVSTFMITTTTLQTITKTVKTSNATETTTSTTTTTTTTTTTSITTTTTTTTSTTS